MKGFPRKLDKVVDKYLEIWYTVLNREIFDNKLPKTLWVGSYRSRKNRGACAVKGLEVKGIYVDPRDPELVRVLLHEMVHAYQTVVLKYPEEYPDHDHAFWQKLKVAEKALVDFCNDI